MSDWANIVKQNVLLLNLDFIPKLIDCAKEHRYAIFKKSFNFFKNSYITIFHYVTFVGDLEFLSTMIKYDEHLSWYGQTMLHVAIQKNHLHIVEFCLKLLKSSPNRFNAIISIPIYWISSIEVFNLLLDFDNLINFNTIYSNQCRRQFNIFRRMCEKQLLPFPLSNEEKEIVYVLAKRIDFNTIPFLKKEVDELLTKNTCPRNNLFQITICYFAVKKLLLNHIESKDVVELITSFINMDRFVVKHKHVRNSRTLALNKK